MKRKDFAHLPVNTIIWWTKQRVATRALDESLKSMLFDEGQQVHLIQKWLVKYYQVIKRFSKRRYDDGHCYS